MPYLEGGEGPPLIFIHGFADQKETWSFLAPRFSRQFRVIVPDLPSHGEASLVELEHATFQGMTRNLELFLDKIGIEGPVHLCGNSMGGGVAACFARANAERVASLSMLNSIGPEDEISDLQKLLNRGENPLIPSTVEEYWEMLNFVFAKRPPIPSLFMRHVAERAAGRHQEFVELFAHMADNIEPWEEHAPQIFCPTLLIHGREDRVIHWSSSRVWARLMPSAQLHIFDGIGHAPQWEAPQRTFGTLSAFFASLT